MLYNVADMDKPTTSEDRDTAAILEGSQLCCSCQLRDMVHCLGGMAILLPLVRALLACRGGDWRILCCLRDMVHCLGGWPPSCLWCAPWWPPLWASCCSNLRVCGTGFGWFLGSLFAACQPYNVPRMLLYLFRPGERE